MYRGLTEFLNQLFLVLLSLSLSRMRTFFVYLNHLLLSFFVYTDKLVYLNASTRQLSHGIRARGLRTSASDISF